MSGRIRTAAALAVAVVALASAGPARALQGPYASTTTRIAVRLTQRLSSQDARAGDAFGFDTSSSVEIAGAFLPAGTHGHGVVVRAAAARGPKPGELVLQARTLDVPGGTPLAVALEPGQLDRRASRDPRTGPSVVVGTATVIGGARETNVIYDAGTAFTIVTPPPEPERGSSGS